MEEYRVFISHSWRRSNKYSDLTNLLNQASEFTYRNYSVPKDAPIPIDRQINSGKFQTLHELENELAYLGMLIYGLAA